MDPAVNRLGASIPLHEQSLGCVVSDCTAHPSMEVGVLCTDRLAGMCVRPPAISDGGGWLYGRNEPPPVGVIPSWARLPRVKGGFGEEWISAIAHTDLPPWTAS